MLPVLGAVLPPSHPKGTGRDTEGSRKPESHQARSGEETPQQASLFRGFWYIDAHLAGPMYHKLKLQWKMAGAGECSLMWGPTRYIHDDRPDKQFLPNRKSRLSSLHFAAAPVVAPARSSKNNAVYNSKLFVFSRSTRIEVHFEVPFEVPFEVLHVSRPSLQLRNPFEVPRYMYLLRYLLRYCTFCVHPFSSGTPL